MVNTSVKIRALKYTDSSNLKEFLADVAIAAEDNFITFANTSCYPALFNKISSFMPLSLKFAQEVFVALEENKIVGLISLISDDKSRSRWKIKELCLKNNFFDIGKLLIDYVVNTFGAEGVESFLTEVETTNIDALNLFKNACGFRECSYSHLFSKILNEKYPLKEKTFNLRDFCLSDSKMIQSLYTESLLPQLRVSLEKEASSFHNSLFDFPFLMFNHSYSKKWVIESGNDNNIVGFINLVSCDFKEIRAFIILSLAYSDYYKEVIDYILYFSSLKSRNPLLTFLVIDCFQSSKKFKEVLKIIEVDSIKTYNILIKDYWRPLKEKKILPNPMAIFPDSTSPACNSLKISGYKE